MSLFSKADYLKLCEQFLKDQYGNDEEDEYGVENNDYLFNEAERIKEKLSKPSNNGIFDLTKAKKDKIKDAISKCSNLKVGDFVIKITTYHSLSNTGSPAPYTHVNISLYEENTTKHLGRISKMLSKINPNKDARFENRPWLVYFKSFDAGIKIPVEELSDIVRWLQAIGKMSAFV